MLLSPAPDDLGMQGWRTAAFALWMAIWWACEAVPVPVTALLPIALFPLFGVAGIAEVTAPYAGNMIFLFLGGFLVALAMQRSNLHRRIALAVIVATGRSGAGLIGGFMVAGALISMWVTNTATAMMLLPIAASIVSVVQQNQPDTIEVRERFPRALLLGVAYSATIGGLGTLIGTPPNALLAAFMEESYGVHIGFAQWMLLGVPLVVVLLPVCWWLLARRLYRVDFVIGEETRAHLRRLRASAGSMTSAERRVALLGSLLALAWIARPLLARLTGIEGLSDTGIAIAAGMLLFVIPSGACPSSTLLRWEDAAALPWGILLLFGGGLSLAASVSSSGLAHWLGTRLLSFGITRMMLLVVLVTILVIFLTELTSNLATAATFLPVVAAVASEAGFAPIALTVPVALAASCAFMLPVATPPNAVVFGSGLIEIGDMVRAGFWMNLIGIAILTLAAVTLAPLVLG